MNDGADLLNKTCGTDNPGTVTSDSSGNYMGFQAELSAGGTFTTTTRVSRQKNILTEQCWLDCELYNKPSSARAARARWGTAQLRTANSSGDNS